MGTIRIEITIEPPEPETQPVYSQMMGAEIPVEPKGKIDIEKWLAFIERIAALLALFKK